MSGEAGAPGPEPAPVDRPAPPPSNTGNVVGGVFLIGCGLCLALVGGGCTTLFVMMMAQNASWSMKLNTLSTPIGILLVGVVAIVIGVRLVTKRPS